MKSHESNPSEVFLPVTAEDADADLFIGGDLDALETPKLLDDDEAAEANALDEEMLQAHYEMVSTEIEKATHNIEHSAPELLWGKLPDDQVEQLGSTRYCIGFNQSGQSSIEEASEYIAKQQGIGLNGLTLTMRFRLAKYNAYSPDLAAGGYYMDPEIGRFVLAIPLDSDTRSSQAPNATYNIQDFYIANGKEGFQTVNPKYIAGFIDEHGSYSRNSNFGKSDIPNLEEPQEIIITN